MSIHSRNNPAQHAFTLTEILVVLAIIVLMIAVAIPTFSALSGGRSQEGALNQLSALLGRARAEAIGVQQVRGVACFIDTKTGQSMLAVVHQPFSESTASVYNTTSSYAAGSYVISTTGRYFVAKMDLPAGATPPSGSPPADDANWAETDQYVVDAVDDADVVTLPPGIGIQMVNDCTYSGGVRTSNGYVCFGAVLFNGQGQVISKRLSFAYAGRMGTRAGLTEDAPYPGSTGAQVYSQLGFVLYDLAAYTNNGGKQAAQSIFSSSPSYPAGEQAQETWLDNNASPIMVNRYSGMLVKEKGD